MTSGPIAGASSSAPRSSSGVGSSGIHQLPGRPPRPISRQHVRPPLSAIQTQTVECSNSHMTGSEQGSNNGRVASKSSGSSLKHEVVHNASSVFIEDISGESKPHLVNPQFQRQARGRPELLSYVEDRVYHEKPTSSQSDPSRDEPKNLDDRTMMPMPMPARPHRNVLISSRTRKAVVTPFIPKKDAKPKPYAMEVSSAAPWYPPNGHVDHFPWSSSVPENQFSEDIIRQGYFDKPPNSMQREIDTAKPALFNNLKQKPGLQALSGLFTSILHQRRIHGMVTAPSTFKPPPRVTLPDGRKEIWLKDLANPNYALRKLSRSIPHGIKNKQLLEQCWIKRVPIERAVWLTKCVGANEIRAANRPRTTSVTHSIGGEAKWIREWTGFVVQFVESSISSFGDAEWKEKIAYSIRLSAHLYNENLLDKFHYLDWMMAGLESSSIARLPVWLLIAQIYWSDLIRLRKYGRRLVSCLCNHLQEIHDNVDKDLLEPIQSRLVSLLQELLETQPRNFIGHRMWPQVEKILVLCVVAEDSKLSGLLAYISGRNTSIADAICIQQSSPEQQLVDLLDQSILDAISPGLARNCWELALPSQQLTRTVLNWAVSAYRPGLTKSYIAVRLLRNWGRTGLDVTEAVLDYMCNTKALSGSTSSAFYHLVAELARSGYFSASRYLQWLIARGGIRGSQDMTLYAPCTTRLLAELPLTCFPENLENLRQTLLNRGDFSTHNERGLIDHTLTRLAQLLPKLPALERLTSEQSLKLQEVSSQNEDLDLKDASRTVKSEIGLWLRSVVREHVMLCDELSTTTSEEVDNFRSLVTSKEYGIIRRILVDTSDMSILADVMKSSTSSHDLEVLSSIADTLDLYFEVFDAIGAASDLFLLLLNQLLKQLDGQYRSPHMHLLQTMLALATRVSDQKSYELRLIQEIKRCDEEKMKVVCSPVSNDMSESLHRPILQLNFADEFEKILTSGNTMDTPTLEHLFLSITVRMEHALEADFEKLNECQHLLARLRTFDARQFDVHLNQWSRKFISRDNRLPMSVVLFPLVGLGCLKLTTMVDNFDVCLKQATLETLETTHRNLILDALDLLTVLDMKWRTDMDEQSYPSKIELRAMSRTMPSKLLIILQRVLRMMPRMSDMLRITTEAALSSTGFRSLLQCLILHDRECVYIHLVQPLSTELEAQAATVMRRVVRSLLLPDINTADELELVVKETMHIINPLTLPFCQLELQGLLACSMKDPKDHETLESCLKVIEAAINDAMAADDVSWIALLRNLDATVARYVCERAHAALLRAMDGIKFTTTTSGSFDEADVTANRAHLIFTVTSYSLAPLRWISLINQLISKGTRCWSQPQRASMAQTKEVSPSICRPLLLKLLCSSTTALYTMYTPPVNETNRTLPTELNNAIHETRTHLVMVLCFLLLAAKDIESETTIFDLLILLVDDLNETSRLQCVKLLKEAMSNSYDERLCYLFSYKETDDMSWLQLQVAPPRNANMPTFGAAAKVVPYNLKRWEILSEHFANIGENDTCISLGLFQARKS